jgi:hypothetical protein
MMRFRFRQEKNAATCDSGPTLQRKGNDLALQLKENKWKALTCMNGDPWKISLLWLWFLTVTNGKWLNGSNLYEW